ncbi:LPXTG cell wall anchor domain-containing protein [Amycolatopsis echigonensis]|uniref:LPXTG cell wall anchor domain-containing protein n=1 Tax=Amycolatopsis echigonensis TaxID=2576905 RepID=A0A8E2B6Q5_9PSEU|nr:LPXTG cell wall anchor domain-containing protein [Amycolatopsis echigonensis]MBB2502605.1 LPXTG cell wall anchor domain-containing protein [Amycolatopsis echigonensis]
MTVARPHLHPGDTGVAISGWVVLIGFAVAFALLALGIVVSIRKKRRQR